jgi:hypothetical protein
MVALIQKLAQERLRKSPCKDHQRTCTSGKPLRTLSPQSTGLKAAIEQQHRIQIVRFIALTHTAGNYMNALITTVNCPSPTIATFCLLDEEPTAKTIHRCSLREITSHLIEVETDQTQRNALVEKLFNLENQSCQDLMLVKLLIRANIVPLEKLSRLIDEAQSAGVLLSNSMETHSLLSLECSDKLKAILRKVEDGSLTFDQAIEAGSQIYWHGEPVESALHLAWAPTWNIGQSVIEFLLIAGIIDQSDINRLQESDEEPPARLAHLLVSAGVLESCTLQIVTRVRFLLNRQKITLEQALSIVKFCLKYNVDVDNLISSCWPIVSTS